MYPLSAPEEEAAVTTPKKSDLSQNLVVTNIYCELGEELFKAAQRVDEIDKGYPDTDSFTSEPQQGEEQPPHLEVEEEHLQNQEELEQHQPQVEVHRQQDGKWEFETPNIFRAGSK